MIPKIFHPVKKQDFTIRSFKVNKNWQIRWSDLATGSFINTGSGYIIREALWTSERLKLGTASENTYPTNSFDGTYKNLIWNQLDVQYYRFPYDKCATLEHANKRFSRKVLYQSASLISVPQQIFGEEIKAGSVIITGSNRFNANRTAPNPRYFTLKDDINGNLYDTTLNSSSYSERKDLVAYWGFNNEFKRGKINQDIWLEKTKINYESSHFEDVEGSICHNINFTDGAELNLTSSGTSANFNNSCILTPRSDELNFSKIDDFTISFWFNWQLNEIWTQSTLIGKNTMIRKEEFGLLDKPNFNGQIQKYYYSSQSIVYQPTDIYPFRFEIDNIPPYRIRFKRSDGTNILHLSSSSVTSEFRWYHVAAVKSGSNFYLYRNGVLQQSGSEVNYHPINKHLLTFGADNYYSSSEDTGYRFKNEYIGKLDEIRIYNKGLSQNTIRTLSDSSSLAMYQSNVVGNVFYKSGNIVISSLDPKHNKILNEEWEMSFKGTHTIYNYEALVRIKKGWFNHTTNSTVKRSPNSDLLIDEVTGSLKPYFHTIGLYNDKNELMAVGKINQPIQLRDDVDLNLITRFHG